MKRNLLLYVAAVLLLPVPANAVLTVHEYVSGQKVTLDSNTGNYWYWNLRDFTDMTYDEQQTAIAGLGNYGNIAGGWHMAGQSEIQSLWTYSASDIANHFRRSGQGLRQGVPFPKWAGRTDVSPPSPPFSQHYSIGVFRYPGFPFHKKPLPGEPREDLSRFRVIGAWVTSSAPVIPAPSALVLTVCGLVSLLGAKRRRRTL